MSSVRISEVAQETAKHAKDIIEACEALGISVKSANSTISEEDAAKVFDYLVNGATVAQPAKAPSIKTKVTNSNGANSKEKKSPLREKAKKQIDVKLQEKKVVEKVVDQNSEEDSSSKEVENEKPLNIARGKRTGLRIVKKKTPIVVKKEEKIVKVSDYITNKVSEKNESPDKNSFSYGKNKVLNSDVSSESEEKKNKSKKTPKSSKKKESGIKLDLLIERDLSQTDTSEDLIFMPDLKVSRLSPVDTQKQAKISKKTTSAANRVIQSNTKPQSISRNKRKKAPKIIKQVDETITSIAVAEEVRVYEFADLVGKNAGEIIKVLFGLGMMVTKNDFLEKDAIDILAEEFGVEVTTKNALDVLDYVSGYDEKYNEKTEERPPIVTIMGHVDHGKTSLLDFIRKSRVVSGESGGITQHIGAYTVEKNGKKITFIDTPGHEAFTEMRVRGANATDIVIIVVAADDGVMPQTKEAISHAKDADVPIIVAVNKMDKASANPDFVKSQLAELGITPVDWGGDYDCIGISAHTGLGIEELLEHILIQSELLELTANSKDPAKCVVVESSIEKGRGPVSTVIVQNGTLNVGDNVIADNCFGRVRAIINEKGEQVKNLGPSEAGEILGLNSAPMSGSVMITMESDKDARELALKRTEYQRQRELSKSTKATLEDFNSLIAEGKLKSLKVILKADVQGTLEAIANALGKLRNEEVKVEIVHSAVGDINESDVSLASASANSIILGFHVKPSAVIKEKAKKFGVKIKTYSVIYDMIDEVKQVLGGMLSPITKEEKSGVAEIREVFDIPSIGRISGCMVMQGEIKKGAIAILRRGEDEIYRGNIESLKRFKDDVKEVRKGFECGIGLKGFNETQPGDVIECIKEVEIQAVFKN